MSCPLDYEVYLDVRWSDIDRYQHINNANYFRYFEETRILWLAQNPELMKWTVEHSTQFIIVEQNCKYLKEITHPNTLIVRQQLVSSTAVTFTLDYQISTVAQPNIVFTTARVTLVCINGIKKRPQKLPTIFRKIDRQTP